MCSTTRENVINFYAYSFKMALTFNVSLGIELFTFLISDIYLFVQNDWDNIFEMVVICFITFVIKYL